MNGKSIILTLVLFVIAATAVFAWQIHRSYQDFLLEPLKIPAEGQLVFVEAGDSLTAVLQKMEESGLTTRDWRWKLLLRQKNIKAHVGEYLLTPPLNPQQLLDLLDAGEVVQHRFTIIEGWSWVQLLEALRNHPVLEKRIEGFVDAAEFESLSSLLGIEDLQHAEGWFLPETYYFVRGESDIDILRRAHQAMVTALAEAWESRSIGVPLDSPYELLILASIVEKETSLPEERTMISGVFVRRINQGMRLQTDPTVIYGMGAAFDGDIRRRDLRTDTPYNTYTRHGLPPTPIAMPGKQTLIDTANPSEGTALFFVANGEGGHTFSDTLDQHEAAVQKLINRQ